MSYAKTTFTLRNISWAILLAVYVFFCVLMARIALQYISLDPDVAFLRIKLSYTQWTFYLVAFFTHVFTTLLVLPAGLTQFSKKIRKNNPALHRISGRIYAGAAIFVAGPSGFVIGLFANGGLSSRIAFCSLAILWILFTILAISNAWKKKFNAHQKWMIRSFALAMSAITLRTWKYVLVALFHPRPMNVYITVAWLGWVLNLMVAEFIIYKFIKK